MTREVAIKAIQDFIGWFKDDSLIRKALDMAIQALSQEPTVTSTDEPMTMVYPQVDGITPTVVEKPQTEIKPDGTLVVNSVFYPKVKRVLVERGTEGTLFYADERQTGEWIKVESGDKYFPESIVCSRCHKENSHLDFNENAEPIGKVFVTSKFCPNCGAKMRGAEDGKV